MLIAGLTGGIASGKSTVAGILGALGAHIIDLDLLARVVVEPGAPAWQEIVAHFGEEILRPDRTLDREALGRRVFRDPEARQALERIVHPRVWDLEGRMVQEIHARDPHAIVIVDVPLLIELGLQGEMDTVILVHAPQAAQKQRLMARNGFSETEAEDRLGAQMPIDAKIPHAHFVLDNSGDEAATRAQAAALMARLRERERTRPEGP